MPQPPTSSEPNGLTEKKDESQIHSSASSTAPAEARLENAPVAHHAAFAEKRELDTTEKRELTEEDCYDELGYAFSTWKKWTILTVIFLVQTSMNFNTSLYSNGLVGISEKFGVSEQGARCGAMIFLVLYAFGCELWAPWSEEFGRKPILQLSLFLVNIWQLPVALAPNFTSLMVGRALGGLSSAGGSVTLGMIADIFDAENQQYAVAYIVFSSVGGSVLGPVVGGFVEAYLSWEWCIWIQLIFGGFVQILHLICVPETRTTIMMDRIAKKRRKSGEDTNIWGPNELVPFRERFSTKDVLITWARPFKMFVTEPIVLTLSLLSGFSDALIFMQIQSLALVFKQWNFDTVDIGLSFLPFLVGYFIAWGLFIPAIERNKKERAAKPHDEHAQYESRLWFLLYTAPCLPIGLIIFAWTSSGPPLHWMGAMVGCAIIGIANYAIYMATIDYMICAYGPYSASATGGNGWARDFLAGVLTLPATPFYTNIGRKGQHFQDASTILFCIAFVLVIAVYVIYWKGPVLRKRSPFAEALGKQREETLERRASKVDGPSHPGSRQMSRRSSYAASHYASSRNASRRNSLEGKDGQRPVLATRGSSHAVDLAGRLAAQSRRNSALPEGEED
ncbi:putative mfs multidrug transporter [Phaeomoniella chlamydospora]|uniref:Putative mfs multidrug transporter n=1 Tax=Phaeomoniella chlamydospora TaxID=158046 RepID=A0A0G2GXK6_PHACM|nr:putative mfs multidrug transporter [Phaeomoniella chlamydospora]